MGFFSVIRKYKSIFWTSNVIELFERWAWYGFYMAFALYLVNSKDTGAIGLTNGQKGVIMGTGSMLLYFLPMFTGAIADIVGYRRILFLSFLMYLSGFFMIMSFDSFGGIFFAFIWTCIAGAFFKPVISAMISRNTTPETSSIGFGIFYMMVNIGAFIGPFIAGVLMQKSWNNVFYMSMGAIGVNFLITILFFKDPVKKGNKSSIGAKIKQITNNILTTLTNLKFAIFLLIMSLFWAAFNQLYYSFPVFIDQWVDTKGVYDVLYNLWPWLAKTIGQNGTINAVSFSSMDAFFIIAFQLLVSTFVMRFKPLSAMTGGILVLAIGLGFMFSTQNGWFILFGILIFGLGEMASSPKYTEYVGLIAPTDKKALYMGTAYLPYAIGHSIAGWLSGDIYEHISDKTYLIRKELISRNISIPEISDAFTKNDFIKFGSEKLGMNQPELTLYLWNNYQPSKIWYLYSGIAVLAVILLWAYNRFIVRGNQISAT
jgi:proton-dependent oligopeptide transporter, POT family